MQPQLFKDLISEVIGQMKGEERDDIREIWKRVVPPIAQEHSELKEVRSVKSPRRKRGSRLKDKQFNGVKSDKKRIELIVAVDSSPWLYNLNFNKEEWKNKIEEALGDNFSVKIKFRIGDIHPKANI
ncbi:MAG: DUF721 domain-containing protein [Candidatus Omnitrophica bacterium]|nr:DUF721 domain-containing protein [Candidatus Omnitrophota bacterium]